MSELAQIESGIASLQAQRALLGDAVVDLALAPLLARREALRAQTAVQQLRQVSVLFVDSVGSTALASRLEPEDIQAVLDVALQRYTAIVQHHRGRVLQYTGDGLLAAFGADEAREDDAERAVRAALDILKVAQEVGAQVWQRHGVAGFDVRAGIDSGPVLLGGGVDAEGSIRGSTVNMAARMEQTAPPGGLRIHRNTWRQVRGMFHVTEQPPLPVKGSAEPQATWLVHAAKPRGFRNATRGIEGLETRMVAREAELEALQEAFLALHRAGQMRIVSVVGDAGIGKSRLMQEFEHWAELRPEACCLFRARAEPGTQTRPFGLLRDLLAWRLQIADDDDADTARAKLERGIAPLFPAEDGPAQAHLLGHLLGFDFSESPHVQGILDDARQIRNRAFHAAAQAMRRLAARLQAPPLVLLDDVHWADDGSLDFFSYLAQVHHDQPALMVCLSRASLFERRPDWALLAAGHQRLELQPLDKRGSRELVGTLLQRLEPVPAALRELLMGGAEGNPFYMEELVCMLIDVGAIVAGPERWHLLPDKLLAAHVPPTLTGVLQARLDGLPAAEKRALQQAAVVGFVFWEAALAALDPNATAALPALVARGLLQPRDGSTLEGQREFAFRNQLLHQVTVDSVLKRVKRELHAGVAHWLEGVGGPETLALAAEHHEAAGDAAAATRFFARAAADAAARYGVDAMLGFVARALALADPEDAALHWQMLSLRERHLLSRSDPAAHQADLDALAALAEGADDDRWRVHVAMRRAVQLRSAGDYVAAEAAGRRGLRLTERAAATDLRAALGLCLSESLIGQGRYDEARRTSEQALQQARALGDRALESKLINALGLIAMEQGDLTVAAGHFEQGLAMVREVGNRSDEAMRLSNLGSVYPRMGDYVRARQVLAQGLQVARDTGQRSAEAALLLNTASVTHLQGDETASLAFASAAFDAAVACGERDLQAFARLVIGHAELGLGRLEAARSAYAASRDLLQTLTMRPQQVLDPVSGLARVALAEGRPDLALPQAELLLAHMDAGGSFDGTEEPLLLPLTCWKVLRAAGDARAGRVLAAAHAELLAQAARVSDPQARRGFLEQVPHHREIVAAAAAAAAADAAATAGP